MRKLAFTVVAVAVLLGTAVSCRQAEQFLLKEKLEALLEDIEGNYQSFTNEKWNEVSDQWEELIEKYEKEINDFSAEDRKEINAMIGRYAAVSVKAMANELQGSVDDIAGVLGGFFGSLKESLDSLADE